MARFSTLVVALALPLLAGCGSGSTAQTNPPTDSKSNMDAMKQRHMGTAPTAK